MNEGIGVAGNGGGMVSVPREMLDKLSSLWTVGLDMGSEIKTLRAILAQPVADERPFRGPSRWTDSELADGKRGIRWIAEDGVYGRPTGHDVRVYLEANGEMLACECGDCVKFYAAPSQPEQSERELMQLVDERDRAEEWANKLSAAIASHTGAYIGEHSNMNCPWAQALEAIENAAPIAQAAPQPCACRTPEAAATRQKDEAEAVKLQRILFDRHMDCRPADTGLMGWAAAVLSAQQPEQSGISDAMLERAMSATIPGGSQAWVWLFNCEGGMQPEEKHKDFFRVVLRAALSAQGGDT